MITRIKAFFNRKPKRKPRTIQQWNHQNWGNRIGFLDFGKRELVGWMDPKPEDGDILEVIMASGKIALFEITQIEYVSDPKDMFFAKAEDIGYK